MLADICVQICGLKEVSEEAEKLYISQFFYPREIDYITVSGGVGEFVRSVQMFPEKDFREAVYEDIGPMLGYEILKAFRGYPGKMLIPRETIRATVIGAGSHSVSISGSTIGVDPAVLPAKKYTGDLFPGSV